MRYLLLLSLVFSACVKIPETGKSSLILTSPSYENQLGADGYKEVLAKSTLSRDARLTQVLKRVGTGIAGASGHRDYRWEFKLIESEEQNAWCMPGGKVAVYTGILPAMKNEAGMAAVIGHEVAHATLRHAGQRITQQLIVNLGLSVADVSMRNTRHKNEILGLMGAGAAVGVLLPYSRSHETESDVVGLKYMAKAGYDPQEAVRFWERFSRSSGGAPPEFLSTHPAGSSRIRELKKQLPEARRLYQAAGEKLGTGETL